MSHPSTLLAILFSGASLGIAPLHAQDIPSIYQPANAPQPLPPLPTPSQFRWHQQELQIFIHFGVNTFTGLGWGDGTENPDLFAPTDLDCDQWARVAKENGFTRMTLGAKHHDGFCLWPSQYTDHCVKSSKWRDGKGDVVGEFVKACRKYGLGVGIYLSPWDRHDKRYGTPAYNDYYINQVNELFDRYGKIDSFWLDLAFKDEGYSMPFEWQRIYDAMYRRNPAVTIEMGGPDIGWIGNEAGSGLETCWNFTELPYATTSGALPGKMPIAYTGGIQPGAENVGKHPNYKAIPALRYCPKLGDASVRRGWFWNPNQSRGPDWWKQIYFNCIGRGSSMMYGFAPDRRGHFPEEDVAGAVALRKMLDEMYQSDFTKGKPITADSTWKSIAGHEASKAVDADPLSYWSAADEKTSATLEVHLGKPVTFNVVNLQEPVFMGQRVKQYRVEYLEGDTWKPFSEGSTIGHRKLDRRTAVTASKVRLIIEDARAYPLISTFSLHFTSFTVNEAEEKKTGTREEKAI
jgi:alpha-L-fucosidase